MADLFKTNGSSPPSLWEQAAKALAGNEALQQELARLQQQLARLQQPLVRRAASLREILMRFRPDDQGTLTSAQMVERLLSDLNGTGSPARNPYAPPEGD